MAGPGESRTYFIQAVGGGLVKIGVSCWPESRLSQLLCWSPVPLEIVAWAPGDRTTEAYIHHKLRAHRAHSEWFRPASAVLDLMAETKASGAISGPRSVRFSGHRASRIPDIRGQFGLSVDEFAAALGLTKAGIKNNEYPTLPPNDGFSGRVIAWAEERGVALTIADLSVAISNDEYTRRCRLRFRSMSAAPRPSKDEAA